MTAATYLTLRPVKVMDSHWVRKSLFCIVLVSRRNDYSCLNASLANTADGRIITTKVCLRQVAERMY